MHPHSCPKKKERRERHFVGEKKEKTDRTAIDDSYLSLSRERTKKKTFIQKKTFRTKRANDGSSRPTKKKTTDSCFESKRNKKTEARAIRGPQDKKKRCGGVIDRIKEEKETTECDL
jgi:hypothetical protein